MIGDAYFSLVDEYRFYNADYPREPGCHLIPWRRLDTLGFHSHRLLLVVYPALGNRKLRKPG